MLELAKVVLEVTGSTSEIVFEPLPADDPVAPLPRHRARATGCWAGRRGRTCARASRQLVDWYRAERADGPERAAGPVADVARGRVAAAASPRWSAVVVNYESGAGAHRVRRVAARRHELGGRARGRRRRQRVARRLGRDAAASGARRARVVVAGRQPRLRRRRPTSGIARDLDAGRRGVQPRPASSRPGPAPPCSPASTEPDRRRRRARGSATRTAPRTRRPGSVPTPRRRGRATGCSVWSGPTTRSPGATASSTPTPPRPRDVDWVSGAAIWLRRSALDAIGGWDDGYFMYMEDVDLCWRLGRAGWRDRLRARR